MTRTLCVALLAALAACSTSADSADQSFDKPSTPAPAAMTSTGRSPYFILEPGYQLVLEGKEGNRLVITVLNETKVLDGVETRIVEEHETEAGKLVEVSRNYFAIAKATGDVYYFGEDVDIYKNGKITGHGGSWHAGVDGAKAGLMMPGKPAVGRRYYQEQAPGVALDRFEIVSVTEQLTTPAGKFTNCVKVAESSGLENAHESKLYAPGVGLLTDEDLRLVSYGTAAKR